MAKVTSMSEKPLWLFRCFPPVLWGGIIFKVVSSDKLYLLSNIAAFSQPAISRMGVSIPIEPVEKWVFWNPWHRRRAAGKLQTSKLLTAALKRSATQGAALKRWHLQSAEESPGAGFALWRSAPAPPVPCAGFPTRRSQRAVNRPCPHRGPPADLWSLGHECVRLRRQAGGRTLQALSGESGIWCGHLAAGRQRCGVGTPLSEYPPPPRDAGRHFPIVLFRQASGRPADFRTQALRHTAHAEWRR